MLPQIGVQTCESPQLGLLYIVAGCSGLLDANTNLALFSRSTISKAGVVAQCQHSAATTILQSEKEDPTVCLSDSRFPVSYTEPTDARSSIMHLAQES